MAALASASLRAQSKLWQLGDVARYASHLIESQRQGNSGIARISVAATAGFSRHRRAANEWNLMLLPPQPLGSYSNTGRMSPKVVWVGNSAKSL